MLLGFSGGVVVDDGANLGEKGDSVRIPVIGSHILCRVIHLQVNSSFHRLSISSDPGLCVLNGSIMHRIGHVIAGCL